MWKVIVKKDWEWYLALVEGHDNLYAYGETKLGAQKELLGVVEMMMDFHLEQVESERMIRNSILQNNVSNYAIQV